MLTSGFSRRRSARERGASLPGVASRACVIGMLALLLQSLPTGAALGGSLSFGRDTMAFSRNTMAFQKSSLAFQRSPLAFATELQSRETSTTIEVTLASDVLFDFDKSDIRVAAASSLHDLAELIRSKARGAVGINGYTDGLGGDGYNQRLSERRAASVKSWLVSRERLTGASLKTAGFGSRAPVAPNRHSDGSDDPEGRQLNRRVTILIHK